MVFYWSNLSIDCLVPHKIRHAQLVVKIDHGGRRKFPLIAGPRSGNPYTGVKKYWWSYISWGLKIILLTFHESVGLPTPQVHFAGPSSVSVRRHETFKYSSICPCLHEHLPSITRAWERSRHSQGQYKPEVSQRHRLQYFWPKMS